MKTIEEIFADRTCAKFKDKKIADATLKEIYDLMKLGPTSANSCPLRLIFVSSQLEKEKLLACAMEGNIEKIKSAPVTALFAYDTKFFEQMDYLNKPGASFKEYLASNSKAAFDTAYRNSTLQAAYFMIIARSFGLALGPMSGFNADKLNKTFFSNTSYEINFICNLGYQDGDNPYPRLPRLDFSDACQII
ncbi:MAG: malonic semialdehyde reductase [Rickettsiaceae bacterium]|nr:malonic semialdehyde reductase [Rickettsiaceae bacterium]